MEVCFKNYFRTILIFAFLICCHLLHAQQNQGASEQYSEEYMELKNTIVVMKSQYKNGLGETLTTDDVQRILAKDAEVSKMWKEGKKQFGIGMGIMVPGEIAAGLGLISVLFPKTFGMPTSVKTACIAAGTPLMITGLVIGLKGEKKKNNAVELYIENNQRKKSRSSWEIKGGVTNSGNLGFVVNF